jgi:hypothetical protein
LKEGKNKEEKEIWLGRKEGNKEKRKITGKERRKTNKRNRKK